MKLRKEKKKRRRRKREKQKNREKEFVRKERLDYDEVDLFISKIFKARARREYEGGGKKYPAIF
jgi:hypothetical protein